MPRALTQKEAFDKCKKEGKWTKQEIVDYEKIRAGIRMAYADLSSAEMLRNLLKKESDQWNSVYKLYYAAMHELVTSFLFCDRIKIENHQCLFAYLCQTHDELEFNWDFFENFRTKRNGIQYYGTPITYSDWKTVELQFNLYVKKLLEELN